MKNKLPKGWEWKTLSELGSFIRGVNYKKEDLLTVKSKNSIKLLRANNIQENLTLDDFQYLPSGYIKEEQLTKENDILFCMSSGSKHLVGKNIILPSLINFSFGAFCSVFRTENKQLSNYLIYFLKSKKYTYSISHFSQGTNILNLKTSQLGQIEIPLPPLAEQQKIVAVLEATFEKIDTAIALLKTNIEKIKQLNESVLNEVFENGDWKNMELKHLTSKIGSGSTPTGGQSSYKNNGISLIRSLNVYDNGFRTKGLAFIDNVQASKLKNVEVFKKDVLLNITGASVARCCIVPENILPARVNQHVSILRPKQNLVLPEFLYYALTSPMLKKKLLQKSGGGATREALSKIILEKFNIPFPTLQEQKQIVVYLDQLTEKNNQLLLHYQNKLNALQQLKNSVLETAFTGGLMKEKTIQEKVAKVIQLKVPIKPKRQAIVLAMSIKEHKKKKRSLYRTKGEKLVGVVELHCDIDFGRKAYKDAAGAVDFEQIVNVVEPLASEQNWFGVEEDFFEKDGNQIATHKYQVREKFDTLLSQSKIEFGNKYEEVKRIVQLFSNLKNMHEAEIKSTVYVAWNNLKIRKERATQDAIVTEARENWHTAKLKFERAEFFDAIKWLKENNLVPKGLGKEVKKKR